VNNYPVWWDQTVTIYNKHLNPETRVVTWHKSVVKNCFWKYTGNKITVNESTIETDNTICRIPKNDKYLDRHEWEILPEESRKEHFCLGTGDIIVKGEVEDVIDDYVAGSRSSDLLTKYRKLQGCMLIERCSVNTGLGRGNEHYYVKGV
jgi:hypothetical protein